MLMWYAVRLGQDLPPPLLQRWRAADGATPKPAAKPGPWQTPHSRLLGWLGLAGVEERHRFSGAQFDLGADLSP